MRYLQYALLCALAGAIITPVAASEKAQKLAISGRFYYRPGDRLPFWYKNVESTICPKGKECNGVGLGGPVYVLETSIVDIHAPNSDHAALTTVEGSCMKRPVLNPLGTEMGITETCGRIGTPVKGIGTMAMANCLTRKVHALSGFDYRIDPERPDNETPYVVRDNDGKRLDDGARLRATVEQFKALCPEVVIGWQKARDGFGEDQ